jgi:hypothetical protein
MGLKRSWRHRVANIDSLAEGRGFELPVPSAIAGPGGAVERHMIGFQAAYARRGIKLELGERLALGFQFHLAKSREDGMLLQRLGQ